MEQLEPRALLAAPADTPQAAVVVAASAAVIGLGAAAFIVPGVASGNAWAKSGAGNPASTTTARGPLLATITSPVFFKVYIALQFDLRLVRLEAALFQNLDDALQILFFLGFFAWLNSLGFWRVRPFFVTVEL
jgi:hypothetical protein